MLRKLEKYEIHEEIGHGGMATVYRAHDTVLDREVALKVMHPHLRAADEARKRFHREARSVARLRHPKVLEIYDFSDEGSEESYIAMEMLTGPTLKRWREGRDSIPAEIAACIAIEIASALEAAHEANIVHRDVKPENVLLHQDRTLKLTDFGIADMIDAISMTATGQILGSPGHMAPEQIEGRDSDKRTDLFSLGTVLYYLATGRLPFTGRNPHQVLKRIVDGEYADPLRVNPAIGGPLREIIVRSLERSLEARFQTATELRETLEAFVAKIGIDDPSQTLADYLQDSDEVGAELTARAVDALIAEGSRASDAGDVPTALDRYNRVLALDEGNERVLKLIERVGMDRRRRGFMIAAGALCAFGVASGGLAWVVWPSEQDTIVDDTEDAGADGGLLADVASDADAGSPAADAGGAEDAGPSEPDAGRRRVAVRPAGGRTRVVRFVPRPFNVRLEVDGQPVQGLSAELTVGQRHTVQVLPGEAIAGTYEEAEHSRTIPAGSGELQWPVSAQLRRVGLFVRSNQRGLVVVEGGRGRGPTGQVIWVRPRNPRESPEFTVSAPGFADVTDRVDLTAGGDTVEVHVELRRSGVAEAP